MNVRQVPDIKIRAKNVQGNLEWVSLRDQKIKTVEGWKNIYSGSYRISHDNMWYELKPITVPIQTLWGVNQQNTNFIFETKSTANLKVNNLQVTLSKSDEDVSKTYVVNGVASTIVDSPFLSYTLNPTNIEYIEDTKPGVIYTYNTNSIQLPYFSLSKTNITFSNLSTSDFSIITYGTGNANYANFSPPSRLTFSIESSPSWLKSVSLSENTVHILCNEVNTSVNTEGSIIIKCNEYPFMKKVITVVQSATIVPEESMEGANYVVIRGQWPLEYSTYDCDFAFVVDNYGPQGDSEERKKGYLARNSSRGYLYNNIAYYGGDSASTQTPQVTTGSSNETFVIDIGRIKSLSDTPEIITFYLYGRVYSNSISEIPIIPQWTIYKDAVLISYHKDGQPNENKPASSYPTIPPNTMMGDYVDAISYTVSTEPRSDTILCYNDRSSIGHSEYVEQIPTTLGDLSVRIARPLLKIIYNKTTDTVKVTSLRNGR